MRHTLPTLLLLALFASGAAYAETPPPTLLELAGVRQETPRLSDSVLLIIDAQREYVDGRLPLTGVAPALEEMARLLARARQAGTPVIHIVHRGGNGLFDPKETAFSIAEPVTPTEGERVIEKRLPNAFSGTGLEAALASTGRKNLIVVGFMTHQCVSATARAALDHGYRATVVAHATATRPLPDGLGGTIPAATVQTAALAELADRAAKVVRGQTEIQE